MIDFKNTRNFILPINIHILDSETNVMPDGRLYIYGSFDDRTDPYCSAIRTHPGLKAGKRGKY